MRAFAWLIGLALLLWLGSTPRPAPEGAAAPQSAQAAADKDQVASGATYVRTVFGTVTTIEPIFGITR